VTVAELASWWWVEPSYVYEHAVELGALRLVGVGVHRRGQASYLRRLGIVPRGTSPRTPHATHKDGFWYHARV
jgi:hypothetical protein